MVGVFAGIGIAVSVIYGGGLVFVGLCRAIDKLHKLRYRRKLKASVGWYGEEIPELELELGRRYIIELDDGEDIWELKAKAMKQKKRKGEYIDYV